MPTQMKAKLEWTVPPDVMAAKLEKMRTGMVAKVAQLMNVYSGTVQSDAQSAAPWTDQTGNARQGLTAKAITGGAMVSLVLFHTMDYGIYLETAHQWRYAVILPTLEAHYPTLLGLIQALLFGL